MLKTTKIRKKLIFIKYLALYNNLKSTVPVSWGALEGFINKQNPKKIKLDNIFHHLFY